MVKKKAAIKAIKQIKDPNFMYYEKFEIEVVPVPVKELSRWTYRIILFKHKGEKSWEYNFVSDELCKTEKEAVKRGFEFGKNIIDGKHEKYSVKF
jgi:hypothetical protein